jgi:tetratricopeptide (TPR) repeat protein
LTKVIALFGRLFARLWQRPGLTTCVLGLLAVIGVAGYLSKLHLSAWWHYRAAEAALEKGEFAQARTHLAACLTTWSRSAPAHFLAARAARRAGDLEAAEEELVACERLGDATDNTTLEWTLVSVQRGKLTAAVEAFLRRLLQEGDADSPLILETLTQEFMWTNRYADARQMLNLWLELRPDHCEALVRRGWVAEHLLDLPAATADYLQVLALDPERDSVRLRLAELLVQQNRSGEALEHLESLSQRQPGNPAVVVALARCRRRLGQLSEARLLLDKLLAERPAEVEALSERGAMALEADQPDQAEGWLRAALKHEPRHRQANYDLCQCLERLGKHQEAQEYLSRLQVIDKELKRMGQVVGEVMKHPHDAALRWEAGAIFLRNGRPNDGLHWLLTALQEDPLHRPTHQALADYYERIGNQEQAARHRQILERIGVSAAATQASPSRPGLHR